MSAATRRLRLLRGGVALTSPADLPGLLNWSDPNLEAYTNNNPVTTDHDQSGNGRDFTAVGTVTFKTSVQNGKSAYLLNGSTGYLKYDSLGATLSGLNTPFTYARVFKHSALLTGLNQNFFMLANSSGSTAPTHDLSFAYYNGGYFSDRRSDSGGADIHELSSPIADTNWHVLVFTFNGLTAKIYFDGVLHSTFDIAVSSSLTANAYSDGVHRRADGSTGFFNGYFGPRAVYDRALSQADAVRLSRLWLAAYSISAGSALPTLPWDVAGLKAWLRDDCWNYVPDGGAALNNPGWTSKFGNEHAQYQFTAPNTVNGGDAPTYFTGGVNGRGSGFWDGAASRLANTNAVNGTNCAGDVISGTASFSAWGVFALVGTGDQDLFCADASGGGSGTFRLRVVSGAYRVDRTTTAGSNANASGGTPDTLVHSYFLTYDGGTGAVALYIDNVSVISATLNTGTCTVDRLTIGAKGDGTAVMNGYYGEFGLYSLVVSTGDRSVLHGYVTGRWVLGVSGPTQPSSTYGFATFSAVDNTNITAYTPESGPTIAMQSTATAEALNHRLHNTANDGAGFCNTVWESSQTNFTVRVKLFTIGTGVQGRYSDASNYWLAYKDANNLYIYRRQAGTNNLVTSVAVAFVSGTEVKLTFSGNVITATYNGVSVSTTNSFNNTATKCGTYGTSGAYYDDLRMTS